MLCNYISLIPVEEFSFRPLVGVQGQWITYVAQGYVDRWGCTGVQSRAPTPGRWPGFQVAVVFGCLKQDCAEELLKCPQPD